MLMTRLLRCAGRLALPALLAAAAQSSAQPPTQPPTQSATQLPAGAPAGAQGRPRALPMLRTEGTRWLAADGSAPALRGVNLGNYLIQEFWMMGQGGAGIDDQCKLEAVLDQRFGYAERERLYALFRDNWITPRDWDMLPKLNLNLVRLPFIYSVVEDEKNPRHLRADAWRYLDDAIDQAEKRGIYVVLDLHGAVGGQGWEHHSGCAGKNQYWDSPEFQERTVWLWRQIAARYKDRAAVAGYSVLNEPWGTTPDHMATVVATLYQAIREVDPNHVIILPGHVKNGIDSYGKPSERGMDNVAFEMHPYPGHFGWGKPGLAVHRGWLQCGGGGDTVCAWKRRLDGLNTAFFVGEFQPWALMGAEAGGQVTRVTYDTYVANGWASTAWAYKLLSNKGGQGKGTWGMVTNAPGAKIPKLDFNKASLAQIENLFRRFGSVPYQPQQTAIKWMNAEVPPTPFAQ